MRMRLEELRSWFYSLWVPSCDPSQSLDTGSNRRFDVSGARKRTAGLRLKSYRVSAVRFNDSSTLAPVHSRSPRGQQRRTGRNRGPDETFTTRLDEGGGQYLVSLLAERR